jgi:hypothetical protein
VKGAHRLSRRDLMAIGAAGVVGSLLKTQVGEARALAGPSLIEHVVVILRENHSYDNYFGKFPGVVYRLMWKLRGAFPVLLHKSVVERLFPDKSRGREFHSSLSGTPASELSVAFSVRS